MLRVKWSMIYSIRSSSSRSSCYGPETACRGLWTMSGSTGTWVQCGPGQRYSRRWWQNEQPLACSPYGSHQSVFVTEAISCFSEISSDSTLEEAQNFDGSLILKYVPRKEKGPPISYLQFPLAVSCSWHFPQSTCSFSSFGFLASHDAKELILEAQGEWS